MSLFSAEFLALLAAFLFGAATTLSRPGLRYVSARTGASISVPSTAVMFWLLSPFYLTLEGLRSEALILFVLIGILFPAIVSILNFESTRRMGPVISSAVTSTSAAFALFTAILFLGEAMTWKIALGTLIIILGVAAMSWQRGHAPRLWPGWLLVLPLSAALLRGNAQSLMKYALTLWPNPFAASLAAYTMSALVVWVFSRFQAESDARFDVRAVPWFLGVGFCNGTGLLLTYAALQQGRVGTVAPIVTTAPLFTLLLGALFLREETPGIQVALGVAATVIGVVLILIA
jgi:drug/metabolite transporter (DMT)-like permease